MNEDFSFQSEQVAVRSQVIALIAAAVVGSGAGVAFPCLIPVSSSHSFELTLHCLLGLCDVEGGY